MIKIWLLTLICMVGISCTSSTSSNSVQQGIVETPSDGSVRNSSIIHNPVTANGVTDSSKVAKITFDETTFDFGTVDEGTVVKHKFRFQNTGKQPLIIGSCRSTCGCTVPKWPREPILPGEYGEINVRFNTESKKNKQTKPVTINANTLPSSMKVYMKGFVNPK